MKLVSLVCLVMLGAGKIVCAEGSNRKSLGCFVDRAAMVKHYESTGTLVKADRYSIRLNVNPRKSEISVNRIDQYIRYDYSKACTADPAKRDFAIIEEWPIYGGPEFVQTKPKETSNIPKPAGK